MSLDADPDPAGNVTDAAAVAVTSLDPVSGGVAVSSTPTVPAVPGTPSWLTGEFYAAIAPFVAAVGGLFAGHHLVPADVERQLIGFGAVVLGVYALARTGLKMLHVHSAAVVARAQSLAVAQAVKTPPAVGTFGVGSGGNPSGGTFVGGGGGGGGSGGGTFGRPSVDPATLARAVADELDRRFVLTLRRTPRRKPSR